MEGWIKLHRKFINWEWYQDSKMVRVFIHLLLMANHKDKPWQGHEIKRGQFITGLPKLSEQTGLSIQSIRTCLDKLESTGEINRQTNSKFSVITVCNYDDYQDEDDNSNRQTNSPATGNQQASNSQSTTTKNEKKVKNENKFVKPTQDEVKKYCKERSRGVNPVKWFNHYTSNGWKVGKNLMKNWHAAVHTWEDSDIGSPGTLPASKGTNLGGSKLPDNYGVVSNSAMTHEEYQKQKKEKKV